MRVMHILDTLNRGGAEMMELDLCNNSKRYGLDLLMVTTSGGELLSDFQRSGVEVVCLNRKLPFDPRICWQLHRLLLERRVDVVHAHQAVDGLHAYFGAKGTRAATVLSFHGYADTRRKLHSLRFLVPRMNACVVVSESLGRSLRESEGYSQKTRFSVVHNGVDPHRLEGDGGLVRHELAIDNSAFVLGMVGSFSPWKDQMTLCKALPLILKRHPNVHAVFAGGVNLNAPHLYEEVSRYCGDNHLLPNVHFLGPRKDVGSIVRSLDMFVLSSIKDTFGNALVEAMMLGVPSLASDIEPFREISNGGEVVRLFGTGNAEDLAKHVQRLIEDRAARERLANQGRNWARRFTIENHIRSLAEMYSSVMLH